jgi:hypothetical protein
MMAAREAVVTSKTAEKKEYTSAQSTSSNELGQRMAVALVHG